MKIKSKFKDYYDYVEHAQGGGDPLCVYLRDYVRPDERSNGYHPESFEARFQIKADLPSIPNKKELDGGGYARYGGLFVAGRFFILRQDLMPMQERPVYRPERVLKDWHIAGDTWEDFEQGTIKDRYKAACLEVGHPVFWFGRDLSNSSWFRYEARIYGHTPKLGPLGMAQFLTAEQVYQEIAFYISNVLKPVEVASPPLSDVQKVESHGFDKRQSFRHRK